MPLVKKKEQYFIQVPTPDGSYSMVEVDPSRLLPETITELFVLDRGKYGKEHLFRPVCEKTGNQ